MLDTLYKVWKEKSALDTLLYTWRLGKAETFETGALPMALEHVQRTEI